MLKPHKQRLMSREAIRVVLAIALTFSLGASPVLAWGPEGHRIVARIAAAHLSPAAVAGVKMLLQSDPQSKSDFKKKSKGTPSEMAKAMADVANWADDVKKPTSTQEWHFLDLASSDTKADIPARCPGDECITEKIKAMKPNLKAGNNFPHTPNPFTPTEQLKFVIHFMGDLHQPLHCATNADCGGNCLKTAGFGTSELHAVWDGGMIRKVLLQNTNDVALANTLDTRFVARFDSFVSVTGLDDMAVESHLVAFQAAYGPLLAKGLLPAPEPRPFLKMLPAECLGKAPDFFTINPHPKLTDLYDQATFDIVSQQLATGGYRLAALLNSAFE
jgi:hypothetical protein